MTPSMEAAKSDKQPVISAVSSPKSKPASSPKPKPDVTGRPSGVQAGSALRLTPFDAYQRVDSAGSGSSNAASAEGRMTTKPVAKKRLTTFFPGGTN
ncbi:hypothetical protein Clim_1450 [Chlorobium limicola DSM 245]|uniref:Uncharacterized protein n=1 Tax=Chlorobium limicola (strain DSM 245 / NBRC 103803 / 6330) TaxID=290315 RepID=B3ED84_CHLL2|nr:hypothetical protein [Chlorobium limicola]ACD90509.1 hypothetical protein Clim_1450 [Chlorobium limicola DSM 245]